MGIIPCCIGSCLWVLPTTVFYALAGGAKGSKLEELAPHAALGQLACVLATVLVAVGTVAVAVGIVRDERP